MVMFYNQVPETGYLDLPPKNKKEEGMLVFCLGHRHIICDLFADVSIQYTQVVKGNKEKSLGISFMFVL